MAVTMSLTVSWIPTHLGECVCVWFVLLTSDWNLPGRDCSTSINNSHLSFHFFILCSAHTHTVVLHTHEVWTTSSEGPAGRMVLGLWSSSFNVQTDTQEHERPASVTWLRNGCINVGSVSKHAIFPFSEWLSITSNKAEKQLLTSTSQLVCCILESHAALIRHCSKH